MQMVKMFSGRSPVIADLLADAARRPAAITFDRDYVLSLGGVDVRMVLSVPPIPAATPVSSSTGDNVLFSGDVVMNESFLAATGVSSARAWMAAFDTFEAMKPQAVVPSHGAMGTGALIAANRAVVSTVQTRARELKAQGRSADEAATTIQQELQKAHPDWPRANGSALALGATRPFRAEAPQAPWIRLLVRESPRPPRRCLRRPARPAQRSVPRRSHRRQRGSAFASAPRSSRRSPTSTAWRPG